MRGSGLMTFVSLVYSKFTQFRGHTFWLVILFPILAGNRLLILSILCIKVSIILLNLSRRNYVYVAVI